MRFLVHVLPLLHLCSCLVIASAHLEAAWGYMLWIDAPVSVFVLALAYSYDRPFLLFGTIGTLWWYLLSYAAAFSCFEYPLPFRGVGAGLCTTIPIPTNYSLAARWASSAYDSPLFRILASALSG
jgi:hypothetical protein